MTRDKLAVVNTHHCEQQRWRQRPNQHSYLRNWSNRAEHVCLFQKWKKVSPLGCVCVTMTPRMFPLLIFSESLWRLTTVFRLVAQGWNNFVIRCAVCGQTECYGLAECKRKLELMIDLEPEGKLALDALPPPGSLNMISAIWVWSLFCLLKLSMKKTTRLESMQTQINPWDRERKILRSCLQHKEPSWSDTGHGFPRCRQRNTRLDTSTCHCGSVRPASEWMRPHFTSICKLRDERFFCEFH